MKNKKAMVLKEYLEILLAIIFILALLYIGYILVSFVTVSSELNQARASLDSLVEKINSLEEGEIGDFIVESPKSWYLVASNVEQHESGEVGVDLICGDKDCLCICPKDTISCKDEGTCKEIDGVLIRRNISERKTVDYRSYAIPVNQEVPVKQEVPVNSIVLHKVPKALAIKKTQGEILISENA